MAQQLSFVADENGVLLLGLIEAHDGVRDLSHQVAAVVCRLQIQLQGQLAEQVQSRPGAPVQIEDFIQVGIESGGEGAGGGGFAGADFPGEQTGAVMLDQKLEARLDLSPGLRSEQLFGLGTVAERRFLETEESFHHGDCSFSSFFFMSNSTKLMPVGSGSVGAGRFAEGNCALRTGSTRRATPCAWPWK